MKYAFSNILTNTLAIIIVYNNMPHSTVTKMSEEVEILLVDLNN